MDKTIEVVVVATVVIVTAVTIVFMVRGQADGFLGFSEDQQMSSKCDLWKETDQDKYRSECSGTQVTSWSPDTTGRNTATQA